MTQRVRLGRGAPCELRLGSNHASREHAHVFPDAGDFFLEDLQSGSGTFLRQPGQPARLRLRGRHQLSDGDRFVVGNENVLARFRDQPLETPLIRQLEDEAAAHPDDAARREAWIEALLAQGDPLGDWLRAKEEFLQIAGTALSWENGLIRTAVVSDLTSGSTCCGLASHLICASSSSTPVRGAGHEALFVEQLLRTRLPALSVIVLRGLSTPPQQLPLAPRLVGLVTPDAGAPSK